MSNLRIVGVVVGVLGMMAAFFVFRGLRWRKSNFILSLLFSFSLTTICLDPNTVNILRDILALKATERGRLIALLIASNIGLWFLLITMRTKHDKSRHQFDLLVRSLAIEDIEHDSKLLEKIKPVMIIIPAFNEARNLEKLLPQIPRRINDCEVGVLVVDDGSTDDTIGVVSRSGYLVIENKINRGQGAASRLGYDILRKHDVPVGVTMDADNQHLPEDIENLIQPVLRSEYDLIIGSRMIENREGGFNTRYLGILIFSKLISLLAGKKITDGSSGFKAFDTKKMAMLDLREDQFQSSEVIIAAARKGLRIGEVPITVKKRKFGESKKGRDWKYGLDFARTILKTWWSK